MPLLPQYRVLRWTAAAPAAAGVVLGLILAAAGSAVAQDAPYSSAQPTYAAGPSGTGRGLSGRLDDDTETAPDLPATIPSDDPSRDTEERDPIDQVPGEGQRPVLRDGDLSWPPEPRAPVDGIVQQEPDTPIQDGIDPLTIDTRPQEDIDAFESPPAGHNPLLFQIEDIPPIDDRRTMRLFLQEPYDPVGIRIGSFVLFPEVEIGGSWYSNVLRSQKAQSDIALDFKPSARLVSDWKVHALEFRAASGLSYFSEFDSENDKGYQLEARGRLDLTRRTNLQAFVSRDYSQESRSAIDANAAGDRANLTVDKAGVTLNQRFNRLSFQLRGTVGEYSYSDVMVGNTLQDNSDRDYRAYDGAVRTRWEFKPTLTGFVEMGGNQRDYSVVAQSDGISRDSTGERYRIGAEFGEKSEILRGEISMGYGVQHPDDARLEPIEGVLLDANLAWRATKLTTLLFEARSDISETTTAHSGGVFTRAIGVAVRHAFQRQLIGTAGITYTMQDYQGVDIDDNEWRTDVGLEYFLSRDAIIFGRYRHTIFDSTSPNSDYTSDEFHVGLRLRR